ncbi:alpha/beta-hydrolase [Meira miltonrushii]|uniref:Alpha/beta-hydrolase n=1 Tax=Meira miltonrushii TaxID=1280837 RepID=A0A316VS43_9BASI|nr:alpha/beta-hydrolase [Meira miltonrushii]PWN38325.1 alpha/beta-hydrolase [Meira miltonrushii]
MFRFRQLFSLFGILAFVAYTLAFPLKPRDGAPVAISSAQTKQYIIPAQFASSAYCTTLKRGSILAEDAKILYYAGDGRKIQRVYVAHSPSQGIIVAYQGTNTSSIHSIEDDIEPVRKHVDSRLAFLGKDVKISDGFQDQWLLTADKVLNETKKALKQYHHSNLLVVGHSLGAALALLTSAYISNNINATLQTVLFGLPRVGNDEFANAIDKYVPDQNHIVNYHDPVPHLPGKSLGFQSPSGEIWINHNGSYSALRCPGQENPQCSDSVPFYEYDVDNHLGPYFGIYMGSHNCSASRY